MIYVPAQFSGSTAPGALGVAGGVVMAAGLGLVAWCFYDFAARGRGTPAPWDPPRRLVVGGPYRRVRNPMYLGILAILVGEAIFFRSAALVLWAAITAVAFHLAVVLYEEPGLRDRFGVDYDRYLADVPRWLPRLRSIR